MEWYDRFGAPGRFFHGWECCRHGVRLCDRCERCIELLRKVRIPGGMAMAIARHMSGIEEIHGSMDQELPTIASPRQEFE